MKKYRLGEPWMTLLLL